MFTVIILLFFDSVIRINYFCVIVRILKRMLKTTSSFHNSWIAYVTLMQIIHNLINILILQLIQIFNSSIFF